MLISIDHGNKQVKTIHHAPFTSGLVCSEVRPFGGETLTYQGRYYTLTDQRIPYRRDKTEDERFFVLTLFAIAYELEAASFYGAGPVRVQLAVGLPPAHYGAQQKRFAEYFLNRGTVSFALHDRPYELLIDEVSCYPQSYAAAITVFQTLQSSPRALIIDIGGFTADYLLLRNGEGDLSVCDSLENGVILLYNRIKSRVAAEQDLLLQSRLYPQNDDDVRKLYRSMVQSVIARCLGLPNLWKTNTTITEIRPYWTTVQGSLHYTDYENGYAALSLMKGYGNYGHLEIGSASRCVGCGRLHDRRNSTHCGECEDMCVCKACGSVVPKNSGHFLDGDGFYCAECMQPCSCCGKLLPREALRPVLNRRGRTNQLCPACEEAELANCRTCAARSCCKDLHGLLFCKRSRYTQIELEEQYA